MENFEEKTCLCALNRIFGFEPKITHALISNLGSASEVFRLKEKEIDRILGPYSRHRGKICSESVEKAARELEKLARIDTTFIGYTEQGYPELLRHCADAPAGLYVRSRTPVEKLFGSRRSIAVVGTRNISPYGREWCERIVRSLGDCSPAPMIVSGLALGTDYCAHRTALDSGIPTIGVMATGPETIYPIRHRRIAEDMVQTPGCALVTDYPPGTAPLAIHFLRRNRIIAGLSEAVILTESRSKGGGMMTARLAFSYDRGVYALPGRVDDPFSQGCNELIAGGTAEALVSIERLTESLRLTYGLGNNAASIAEIIAGRYGSDSDDEHLKTMENILRTIRSRRGITVEELAEEVMIPYRTAVEITGILAIDGFITTDLLQRCSINPKFM